MAKFASGGLYGNIRYEVATEPTNPHFRNCRQCQHWSGAPQTVTTSPEAVALSKDPKKLGWRFVGPTTVYAIMQAMGLVNDHVADCVVRCRVERARERFARPGR
jgi:hypothetical protein